MASKYSVELNELNQNSSHGIILSNIRPGSTVLECGSSSGYMTRYMKERLHAHVCIVEMNESDFKDAMEYADDGICANLEETGWSEYYGERCFDYILFADVLEHLRNPLEVLKRAVALLKDDGAVITSIPNIAHSDIIINLLNNRWNYMPKGILDDTHIHFWAKRNLVDFFTYAGLSIINKQYVIIPPYETEQINCDPADEWLPAIDAICRKPYGDVYQYIYFSQKTEFVKEHHIQAVDRYAEQHLAYAKEPAYCIEYARQQREKERIIEEEKNKLCSQYEKKCREYLQKCRDYDEIANSFFWKSTKPLRMLLDKLKYLFRNDRLAHWVWRQLKKIKDSGAGYSTERYSANSFYQPGEMMTVLCTRHTYFVARLVQNALHKVNIKAEIITEEPKEYGRGVYIVICPQMFKKMPGRYIAFQMEQAVSSRWLTENYFETLSHAYSIFDYSLVNIDYFKKTTEFGKKFYYLPVDYLPEYHRSVDTYDYDVAFYGDVKNPRRKQMLEKLQEHFSVKIISEVFGEELYDQLSRAKIVVNIHYYENAMLETTRLYETLSLGRSIVVSERSSDGEEEKRLEGIVDFVEVGDTDAMIERIGYWLSHEEERKAAVQANDEKLAGRANAFDFFFLRFLLANEWLSFDRFYELAGDFVHFNGNRICLSLPEAVDRRAEFDRDNRFGFQVIPGLRHYRGWTGCGLSYKFIMKKAQEQQMEDILVCEDDVLFPEDFEQRFERCLHYLSEHPDWDIFQGLMADVGKVTVSQVVRENGQTFVYLNHMISMVFNYYRSDVYQNIINWDETNDDVYKNTIDRALEAKKRKIVATAPFLVGHKEELDSTVWGFNNTQYSDMIAKSSEKLEKLVEGFERNDKK